MCFIDGLEHSLHSRKYKRSASDLVLRHQASHILQSLRMDLRKQVFKVPQNIPTPASASNSGLPAGTSGHQHGADPPSPDLWKQYWDHASDVQLPDRGTFRVYTAGSAGPVVFCIHGGGYTGLTWSLMAAHLKDKYRVVAPDLRCHGATTTVNDDDLCAETMSSDIIALWRHLFGQHSEQQQAQPPPSVTQQQQQQAQAQPDAPQVQQQQPAQQQQQQQRVPTVLVGHSMGGALAVHAGSGKQIAGLEGVVVVDVVEGTALAALPAMDAVLSNRPQHFSSTSEAIHWALRSGMCKNKVAAAVSLPSQLVADAGSGGYHWRTPLPRTRPYWEGWYTGLSDKFLTLPVPKMLLLAGTDRLDRPLTIGQMQGKFQLVLMPAAGHAIQEDEPDKTAEHVAQFLMRFRVGQPPLVFPKAGTGVRPVLPVVAGPLHQP